MELIETDTGEDAFKVFCDTLGYGKSTGLYSSPSDAPDSITSTFVRDAQEKLGVDAVLIRSADIGGPSAALAYIRVLDSFDTKKIAELHRRAWNLGQAPLLFIVMPHKTMIFSNVVPPRTSSGGLDPNAGFIEELNILSIAKTEIDKRMKYARSELDSDRFWQDQSQHFNYKDGVCESLINNIRFMRDTLINDEGMNPDIVHSLLMRSILVKYFEDRKDRAGQSVFPSDFFPKNFPDKGNCYTDLLDDVTATYSFFRILNEKFNGDILHIGDREEDDVDLKDLQQLKRLLKGEQYLHNKQMALWPLYSFDIIPIELISNIYEQFIDKGESGKRSNGAYYTRRFVVGFLLEEVLTPDDGMKKILDPSCGSGIFLVEAFNRLIISWKLENKGRKPSAEQLSNIIENYIYGIDKDEKAVRIAALSLYLTLCDQLEPRAIWENVRFRKLIGQNLLAKDFFCVPSPKPEDGFDIVVGNPPWISELTECAESYLAGKGLKVGDEQISQAFLLRALDWCKPEGIICLILSSKSLLFNISETNRGFRNRLFRDYGVMAIFNFTALRHYLFPGAIEPASAVLFTPKKKENGTIVYCSPKPSYTPQDFNMIRVEPDDISYILEEEALEDDTIWKTLMYGSRRDLSIINRMKREKRLSSVAKERGLVSGEGFTEGKDGEEDQYLANLPFISSGRIPRYVARAENFEPLAKSRFTRPRGSKEIYKGPHLLIRKSHKAGEGFLTAFVEGDAGFNHSLLGIHGTVSERETLERLCLWLNSRLALYFMMMTSGRLFIKRDEFLTKEIRNLPIPSSLFSLPLPDRFLEKMANGEIDEQEMDRVFYDSFGLTEVDKIFVESALEGSLDLALHGRMSIQNECLDAADRENYVSVLNESLKQSFGDKTGGLRSRMIPSKGDSRVVIIEFVGSGSEQPIDKDSDTRMVAAIDRSVPSTPNGNQLLPSSRHIRRYGTSTIHIVKPNQRKYWTRASAVIDADTIFMDIMTGWSEYFEIRKSSTE